MSAWEGLSPPYSTIVADPPWRFGSAATKADARKHYGTMPTADVCALPVADLAAANCPPAPSAHRVSPGPYVELFARAPRLGWDSWGHGYEMESAS